jgi:hypothetical protein
MVKIDWIVENAKILCKLFAKQVVRGNYSNTYLNLVGYIKVEKRFKR